MRLVYTVASMAFLAACTNNENMSESNSQRYPATAKGNTVDEYFDTKVEDPYRWLEDDNAAETKKW